VDSEGAGGKEAVKIPNVPDSLYLSLRLFMGAVFAYAGFMKLTEPVANFRAVLEQYAAIPSVLLPILAAMIPWLEWGGGLFLILGYMIRPSAFLLSLFSMSFIVLLSGPFWAGEGSKSCGCFGVRGILLTVKQAYYLDWANLIAGFMIFSKKHFPYSLDCLFFGEKGSK